MDSLFDRRYAVRSEKPQNYKDKLLIIRSEILKEEFRTPENQLFLASGGFGCEPYSSGRKVFGCFLDSE